MESKEENKSMSGVLFCTVHYKKNKKVLEREMTQDASMISPIIPGVTGKIHKIKPVQSGKQVSFSKKVEEIPQSLEEIITGKSTPIKTVSSTKYKPCREHIKTPFKLEDCLPSIKSKPKVSPCFHRTMFEENFEIGEEEKKNDEQDEAASVQINLDVIEKIIKTSQNELFLNEDNQSISEINDEFKEEKKEEEKEQKENQAKEMPKKIENQSASNEAKEEEENKGQKKQKSVETKKEKKEIKADEKQKEKTKNTKNHGDKPSEGGELKKK